MQQAQGTVSLNAEQQTRIRQTVLSGSNVPRVGSANFAISVGTAVPTSIHVVEVPPALIEIHPEWRGHMYFVVQDDIVILDNSRRIIAVVPTGSSSSRVTSSSPTGGANSIHLSGEEIRHLQIILNERGFQVGEPDGVLGPRTEKALLEFQQKQGLQATGHIDAQTATALGISNVQGGQSTSQPPGMGQGTTSTESRTGASSGATQPPSAGQTSGVRGEGNQGATSSQSGSHAPPQNPAGISPGSSGSPGGSNPRGNPSAPSGQAR